MPSLAELVTSLAPSKVVGRGAAYQRAGLVKEVVVSGGGARARVAGSEIYDTAIVAQQERLGMYCSCPFADDDVCKHMVALALQLDRDGYTIGPLPSETYLLAQDSDFRGARLLAAMHFPGARDPWDDEPPAFLRGRASHGRAASKGSDWRDLVEASPHHALEDADTLGHYWYLLDAGCSSGALGAARRDAPRRSETRLLVQIVRRKRKRDGSWGKASRIYQLDRDEAPTQEEQLVWDIASSDTSDVAWLTAALARRLLPGLAATGRLGVVGLSGDDVVPLTWPPGEAWGLVVEPVDVDAKGPRRFGGHLVRGEERLPLSRVDAVLAADLAVVAGSLCPLQPYVAEWVERLLLGPLRIPRRDVVEFLASIAHRGAGPELGDVSALGVTVVDATPEPVLQLQPHAGSRSKLTGTLLFSYGPGKRVGADQGAHRLVDRKTNEMLRRNVPAEASALETLQRLGFAVSRPYLPYHRSERDEAPFRVITTTEVFLSQAEHLLETGWRLEVEGVRARRAGRMSTIVSSDQDWFDVRGTADFEGQIVELPRLLQAVRKRQRWIALGDGSRALLPERWLEQLGALAELQGASTTSLRLHATHALMLDGLISQLPDVQTDTGFTEMCQRLRAAPTVSALKEPRGFRGELRDYQRVALGWLASLERLGFGGCLADDMGLGKTVIVLAWLLRRRDAQRKERRKGGKSPSLLVVPKSLLFNWQAECQRFTPTLKLHLHHGTGRATEAEAFSPYDVVLTSYGTLRRDAELLQQRTFDYVVLDEAHQIKNPSSYAHEAARTLQSRHRLALTGTPLENHLGELWTLLTYLNPAFFAALAHLRKAFVGRTPSETALQHRIIASTRPFTLRRTKEEVAPELPERVEQTLYVEQSPAERKLYDELADYYRKRIVERKLQKRYNGAARPGKTGGGDGKLAAEALEALLRLRQAACHPGLVDEARRHQTSAKVSLLMEQLEEITERRHKVLVFSQFTSLLGIVRDDLEKREIVYEYLDGATTKREQAVRRFQEDPDCLVFLISLKAGGVGLNLTAADYVFILDPWWNPAAEAQAIDRAHRIGRQNKVIACRLLARNTVEEKVAILQAEKRDLANAIFGDTGQFAARFTQDDFERLLS